MMQKGFIFIFVFWNLPLFAQGNYTEHLQLPLGCRAVIPCQRDRRDSHSFKWFYKNRDKVIRMFSETENGWKLHTQDTFGPKIRVLNNRSLVIDKLTENDLGQYWCENCFHDHCQPQHPAVDIMKKNFPKEIIRRVEVPEGSNFNYSCQGVNLHWTFESGNNIDSKDSAQKFRSFLLTSNQSIHIMNVERTHAGNYICWTSECPGHTQRLLIINLCVISVHVSQSSSVSCSVLCDTNLSHIKTNSTSNAEIYGGTVELQPYGLINCSKMQMFDGYTTTNSTDRPPSTSLKTADREPKHQIWIYATSAVLTCLILIALLICCYRQRLCAAFPVCFSCGDLNCRVEEEASVIYSSIIITEQKTTYHMTTTHCVYSEIKNYNDKEKKESV